MSKIKNIAFGLGMVASLGIAVLPLATYADSGDYAQASEDLTVNLQVNSVIGMTIRSYSGTPAALNGTTECLSDESASGYTCTTTGNQAVSTTILPGQADTTTMYSDIFVSTNSTNGYTLKLIDEDEVTSLTSTNGDTIATVSGEPTSANPGWGVSVDNTGVWEAMPNNTSATDPTIVAGTPITVADYTPSTPTVTSQRQSTVHYGVAATNSQTSGDYTDYVVYTATAK